MLPKVLLCRLLLREVRLVGVGVDRAVLEEHADERAAAARLLVGAPEEGLPVDRVVALLDAEAEVLGAVEVELQPLGRRLVGLLGLDARVGDGHVGGRRGGDERRRTQREQAAGRRHGDDGHGDDGRLLGRAGVRRLGVGLGRALGGDLGVVRRALLGRHVGELLRAALLLDVLGLGVRARDAARDVLLVADDGGLGARRALGVVERELRREGLVLRRVLAGVGRDPLQVRAELALGGLLEGGDLRRVRDLRAVRRPRGPRARRPALLLTLLLLLRALHGGAQVLDGGVDLAALREELVHGHVGGHFVLKGGRGFERGVCVFGACV